MGRGILKRHLQLGGLFLACWYFPQDGVAGTKFCLVEDLAFPPVWHSFSQGLIVCFLQQRFALKACVEAFDLVQCRIEVVFQLYFWFRGQFDFISLTIVIDRVLQNIKKLFFLFCVNLFTVLLNAICFNTPELLNKFVKSGFICSVSWHMENKFLLLLTCGLLSGCWDTVLIITGEGPTKFSFHTKRLILIARYNMCRVGECECINTEEGADFAIGNIWEMYVAQTVEGITNLIKFKNFCSCEVQGRGAERSREFKRYFSWILWSYCDWLNNFWEGHAVLCIEKL